MDQHAAKESKQYGRPSKLILWIIQILFIVIWFCKIEWAIITGTFVVDLHPEWKEYCETTYFQGYYNPLCTPSSMTACSNDRKCALWHDFFDEDDNFFCRDHQDCEECKCRDPEYIYNFEEICWISLWVFNGIGLLLELVRMFIIFNFRSNSNLETSQNFQAITDSIFNRLICITNHNFWADSIMEQYDQRNFFKFNNWYTYVRLILHTIPTFITVFFVLENYNSNTLLMLYVIIAIVLEILIIVIKLIYRNQKPYNYQTKEEQISNLPTSAQVMQQQNIPPQIQPIQSVSIATATAVQQPGGQPMMVQLPNGQIAMVQPMGNQVPTAIPVQVVQEYQQAAMAPSAPIVSGVEPAQGQAIDYGAQSQEGGTTAGHVYQ